VADTDETSEIQGLPSQYTRLSPCFDTSQTARDYDLTLNVFNSPTTLGEEATGTVQTGRPGHTRVTKPMGGPDVLMAGDGN
jgi:hypothetical protein